MKFRWIIEGVFVFLIIGILVAAGGEINSPKFDEPISPHVIQPEPPDPEDKALEPIKLIVLDPGHGGVDPGAVGPGGVLEKDVVLKVARLLKEIIEKDTTIEVFLTRYEDVFVPLRERSEIANALGADLFISIHANAAMRNRKSAWGFETYFLSLVASDAESRKLALMENYPLGPQPGMETELPPEVSSDLEAILFDMAQTEYIKDSEAFAMIVQDHLSAILDSPDRGVKQAPFMVLMGAAMPAVLVEIGFVSSRREVELLSDPAMQRNIAEALALSVDVFAKRRAQRMGQGPDNPEHAEAQ